MALTSKNLTIPLIVFAFATWAVFLAGLASVQKSCNDGTTGTTVADPAELGGGNLNTQGLSGVYGWSGAVLPCNTIYRYSWFICAFVYVTLLGLLICAVRPHPMGTALHYTRPFWTGMVTISILLMMIESEAFLAAISTSTNNQGTSLARYRTAAAGAISSVAALIGLLFAIGTHWDYDKSSKVGGTGVGGVGAERVAGERAAGEHV